MTCPIRWGDRTLPPPQLGGWAAGLSQGNLWPVHQGEEPPFMLMQGRSGAEPANVAKEIDLASNVS